jgi:hypothetical protein
VLVLSKVDPPYNMMVPGLPVASSKLAFTFTDHSWFSYSYVGDWQTACYPRNQSC